MSALSDHSADHRWPTWLTLTVLAGLNGLFTILYNPFAVQGDDWYLFLPAGALYVQPMLFGTWAAMGSGPAWLRIPIAWTTFAVVTIASLTVHWLFAQPSPNPGGGLTLILSTTCVAWTFLLLVVGKLTRWRIDNSALEFGDGKDTGQFSLKFLLGLTTVCAVLLTAGRGLASAGFAADAHVGNALKTAGYIVLLMYPAIVAALALLSTKQSVRVWLALPVLWALLSFLSLGAYMQIEPDLYNWRVCRDILSIQVGAFATALASALFLRVAGFRLVRHVSKRAGASPTSQ